MLQLSKLRLEALLVLLAFISASCTLLMPAEKRQCYRTLKDFADEHWKFSNHDSLLVPGIELFRAANSKDVYDCTKKMSKKDIKRLFGEPHEIVKLDYRSIKNVTQFYYYTMFCYPSVSEVKACNYYYFDFKENGECMSFGAGGVEKSH